MRWGSKGAVGPLRVGTVMGQLEMLSVRKLQCSLGRLRAKLADARHEMRGHGGVSDDTLPLTGWLAGGAHRAQSCCLRWPMEW